MGSSSLPGFWMSIIGDGTIQEQLLSTMKVKDKEERALTLLTRTLFLIIMEIKCERDEALRTSEGIMEVVDSCDSCRTKVVVGEPANRTTIGSELPFTEAQTPKSGCKERETHTGKLYEANSTVSCKGNSCTSPNEEEEEEEEALASITQLSEEVLVPGTLDMESCFPESQRQRSLITQGGFVAETLDMDNCNTHNTSDMFEDGEDRNIQHTQLAQPVYKASDHMQHGTQRTQHALKPSEHHTPTKWRSPPHPQGAPWRGRERRHLSISERDTRHSPYKTQQEETRTSCTMQNNSCSDISKHRNKVKSGYVKEEEEEVEEYTEDVMVESNNDFRTPRKGSILSPGSRTSNRTPNRSSQSVGRSPEGSPVFRRGGKNRRIPLPSSPSTEAKRDISQAFSVPQKRAEVTGKKGTPEKGEGSPRGSRQQQVNRLSLTSPAEKGKGSPRGSKKHEGSHFALSSPAKKGKESPKGSRQQGSHLALPSPLPSPHNASDELTSPSILQPLGVAPCARIMPPPPSLTPAQQRHSDRGTGGGETGGITAGGGEPEGIRGGRREGGGRRGEIEDIRRGREGRGESEGMKKGGVPLTRSASSLNTFTSARKLSLRRHQTTDVKRTVAPVAGASGSRHHLTVSPSNPQQKKTGYRQTTVYNYLGPQAAATRPGAGSGGRRAFVDDEEALRLAMKESLQLKALADMGRELDQKEQEGGETTSSAYQPNKESPIKLPNLRSALTNPKSAHGSPKIAHNSPRKAQNSPRKAQNSPRPAQLSSKLAHWSSGITSSVKRRIIEAGNKEEEGRGRGVKGKMEEEEKDKGGGLGDENEGEREEEEGIRRGPVTSDKPGKSGLKRKIKEEEEDEEEGVLPSAQEEGKEGKICLGNDSKENASPRKEGTKGQGKPPAKRSNRQEVFQDSFDILPQREEPSFAHMGEVVRKKAARRQLEGWSCKQCKEFYEKAGGSAEEVKELMNKCSRHRSKHKPLSNTPEGFWNPFFDD